MAEQINFNNGGMVGLPGRQGWGLVEDPGHEQIRTFGEVGGIGEFKDAADRKAPPGDQTTLTGAGNAATIPATTEGTATPKRSLDEFLNALTTTPADGLVKNRDSLFNEYQGLLADIKDPLLKNLLAKLFLALLSDPPDMATLMKTAQQLDTYVKTQDFLSGKSNKVPPEVMRLLESKYGKWNGIGKNVDPTKGTGPNGGRLLRDTIRNMLECKDEAAQSTYNSAQKTASPLVFDLNGDGVSTTGVGKTFDLDGDGTLDKTAWAGPGDGVLAFDRDGDGVAGSDGTELFGNNTIVDGKKFENGFEALKALAVKHLGPEAVADGKLGAAELKALSDKTGLCMIVDGKKVSLGDLGITEISVGYQEAGLNKDVHGNEHRQVGEGFVRNGQVGAVNDVWFRYEQGAGEPGKQ